MISLWFLSCQFSELARRASLLIPRSNSNGVMRQDAAEKFSFWVIDWHNVVMVFTTPNHAHRPEIQYKPLDSRRREDVGWRGARISGNLQETTE